VQRGRPKGGRRKAESGGRTGRCRCGGRRSPHPGPLPSGARELAEAPGDDDCGPARSPSPTVQQVRHVDSGQSATVAVAVEDRVPEEPLDAADADGLLGFRGARGGCDGGQRPGRCERPGRFVAREVGGRTSQTTTQLLTTHLDSAMRFAGSGNSAAGRPAVRPGTLRSRSQAPAWERGDRDESALDAPRVPESPSLRIVTFQPEG
jgi:hypothetical protein